jgi:hypothetical protein
MLLKRKCSALLTDTNRRFLEAESRRLGIGSSRLMVIFLYRGVTRLFARDKKRERQS